MLMLSYFFSAKVIWLSLEYGFSGFFFLIWAAGTVWIVGLDTTLVA